MSCLLCILFHIKVLLNKAFLRRVVLLGVFRVFFRICSPLKLLLTFYFGFSVSAVGAFWLLYKNCTLFMQKTGVQSSQKGYEFFKNAEKRPIFLNEPSEIS